MATILISGKHHIRDAKIPRYSQHKLIFTSNQHQLLTRLLINQYTGFSRTGIVPLGGIREKYDLIHSLNNIALTSKPWIVTFEDILPRTFGRGGERLAKMIRHRLIMDNCYKLVGQSHYALKKLARANHGWRHLSEVMAKTTVIYPSIDFRELPPKKLTKDPVLLVFIGNHFARKGGISAVRLAKLALDKDLPITIHIVSKLLFGAYTDFADDNRYKNDLKLLELPNVVFHGQMDNTKVMELLQQCDFQYMPTVGDTFGYSILEGFSVGTPAIVTNTCAMPELVHHNQNGYLLDVEVNNESDIIWLRPAHDVAYRTSDDYWETLDRTYSDLANQTLSILEKFMQDRNEYERLSAGAINQVKTHYDSRIMSECYDSLYEAALNELS